MRHVVRVSRLRAVPAPARSLLVWQAQLELINEALDVLERALAVLKGTGSE